jgi:hypothetical protein
METFEQPQYGFPAPVVPERRRKWPWVVLLIGIFLTWSIGSCFSALMTGGKMSDSGMAEMHSKVDSGDCAGVYRDASSGFRQSVSLEEWTTICEGVRSTMGRYSSAERGGINSSKNTSGSFVAVQYKSKFAEGDAEETFTWRREGQGYKLYGYNINSKRFLQNMFKK